MRPRNDRSGPPDRGRPVTYTTNQPQHNRRLRRFHESRVERAKRELGAMQELLAIHGYQPRSQRVRCPAPDHEDRHPSASVYIGRNGDERIHCFSCNFDGDVIDVARALGMIVELGTPERELRCHRDPRRPISRREAEMLASRPDLAFEWIVATTLARVPEPLAQRDLLASWDWLADRVDIPFVVVLSRAVRGTAFLRFGSACDLDVRQAVDRLMREVAA